MIGNGYPSGDERAECGMAAASDSAPFGLARIGIESVVGVLPVPSTFWAYGIMGMIAARSSTRKGLESMIRARIIALRREWSTMCARIWHGSSEAEYAS